MSFWRVSSFRLKISCMILRNENHQIFCKETHTSDIISSLLGEVEIEDTPTTNKENKVSGSKRKAKTFKDEEYFISSVPTNQHFEAGLSVRGNEGFQSNRLDAAVLDLAADDSSGLQKQKTTYHWDKRSKKYIKLNNGDRVTASGKVKTESGAKVKANKTGIYKRWKERSHNKISFRGTGPEGNADMGNNTAGDQGSRMSHRRFQGGRNHNLIPNAHVRSEIKDNEQVRKERQKKASRLAQMKSNPKKGKKFGKGGKGKRGKTR